VCGGAAALIVALASSAIGRAALASGAQAPTLATMPQIAQDVGNPSAKVRRQALRALRERGGPETLPLLARLLADAETDIREGALAGVISVRPAAARRRSINGAAEAFQAARFRVELWPLPHEVSGALVKALADDWPSVRRAAAHALGSS
jgi:HEAT repeat protein